MAKLMINAFRLISVRRGGAYGFEMGDVDSTSIDSSRKVLSFSPDPPSSKELVVAALPLSTLVMT